MPFATTWMYLEIIILIEVSETEKDKYHMISLYMWNLKNDTNELIYKTEIDSKTQRTDLQLPRREGQLGRAGLGVWDQQMQTIIYRMDKQQGPIVQHWELYLKHCNKP